MRACACVYVCACVRFRVRQRVVLLPCDDATMILSASQLLPLLATSRGYGDGLPPNVFAHVFEHETPVDPSL